MNKCNMSCVNNAFLDLLNGLLIQLQKNDSDLYLCYKIYFMLFLWSSISILNNVVLKKQKLNFLLQGEGMGPT